MTMATKLWLVFFLAQLIHMACKAKLAAKSAYTPWQSIRAYIVQFWPQLLGRLFLASMGFGLWIEKSSAVQGAIALAPDVYGAGIVGWFADSVLDKVLAFVLPNSGAQVPKLPDDPPAANGAAGGGS